MKAKKKKREALKIAIILAVAAAKGGAKNAVPTILSESYHAALALLDDAEPGRNDDAPTQPDHAEHGNGKPQKS